MIINLNINDFAQISSKVIKFEALKFLNLLCRLAAGFKGLTPFRLIIYNLMIVIDFFLR